MGWLVGWLVGWLISYLLEVFGSWKHRGGGGVGGTMCMFLKSTNSLQ